MEIKIECGATGLKIGETRLFPYSIDGKNKQGFIIQTKLGLKAYENKCCHWPTSLDLGDGELYNEKLDRIQCKTHGATYILESGSCDFGPCVNGKLTELPLKQHENLVIITID